MYVLKASTIPENVGLHFTCPAAMPYDYSAGFNNNFFKWWEYLSMCTLWDERVLQEEFNTRKSTCVQMEKHD